ncbi:MAG: patatin-like phospholipase family protein [Candidatus Binataceae bacterium]|nr:patatin-like phospholipase family protein [Candidatus Binataceae bacterium]
MARLSKPWGIIFAASTLFLVAWWIEDCFIYYIDWSQIRLVRLGAGLLDRAHIPDLITTARAMLAAADTRIANGLAAIGAYLARSFDSLPPNLRANVALRMVAWCAATIRATFGGDAMANFGRGVLWAGEKLLKALIALNGGFWLYNIGRRVGHGLDTIISFPVRFYGERGVEGPSGPTPSAIDEGEPIEEIGRKRDSRARRREYVQFFQGHVERIGIILAGGGARGAYQAGALKAIHEFLREYKALHKVKMIAGTSIGAWNAMFWLADLMDSEDRQGRPGIETWWKNLKFSELVEFPWLYVPFVSQSMLRATPWRESFVGLFNRRLEHAFGAEAPINFYFTRADVEAGVLQYATNRADIENRIDALGRDKDDDYRFFDLIGADDDALKRTAEAVFASIDLPPAFPFARIGKEAFEDGGAIDNLPIRFGAPIEDCDLLFVLPLNATFEDQKATGGGLLRRVLRIADIRQGVLERKALSTANTINRFAQRVERLDFGINTLVGSAPPQGVAAEALSGVHEEMAEFNAEYKLLYVFSICPAGQLAIGTFDFWKRKSARDAFDLMYLQTKRELQSRLFEDIEPEDPHMVLVDAAVPESDELPKPRYRRLADL